MPPARLLALVLVLLCPPAWAQEDPNLANPTKVVTVKRDGYTISALVTHLESAKAFKQGILLFSGYPGILRLEEVDGKPRFRQAGNFLVRSRRFWLDDEILVAVMDAPSNQWANFSQAFRETPQYGADVEAIVKELSARYGVSDWTFVGTSEGSVSAFHAARMNPSLAKRTILTASMFRGTVIGPGLSGAKYQDLASDLLFVHHESDPCDYTTYRMAREAAEKAKKPLVTVRGGGEWRGQPCEAFSAHGFVGIERETVLAMRSWVKTGTVPPDVAR